MNFFRTLLNCCAGFRFYRSLLPLSPMDSMRFLAILVLFVVVIQIGTFIPVLKNWMKQGAYWVHHNLPRFEIQNGKAHYDAEQPFVYTNQLLSIVIDTSGNTNQIALNRPYWLFIGEEKIKFGILYEDREGKAVSQMSQESLSKFPSGTVNADYILKLAGPWLWRYGPFAMIAYFFGWMLAVSIQAYLFTLVISFAESASLRQFGFNQFFNIAAHACAPAAIVVTALIVARTYRFEWLMIAFLGTYFIYVMGATAACRRSEEEEEDRDGLL